MVTYRIKTVVTSTGERLPMLLGREGAPVWGATLFTLTELRARNRSSSTIENALNALIVLQLFVEQREIDLQKRMAVGALFRLDEVEDLVRTCRLSLAEIRQAASQQQRRLNAVKLSLERFRSRGSAPTSKELVPALVATRLRYIRDYLNWLAVNRMSRLDAASAERSVLSESARLLFQAIEARLPLVTSRDHLTAREGLEPEVVAELLRITACDCSDNPWFEEHARRRNELLILWLFHLGLRRGELLGVRVSDIDFRAGTVMIARRADDVADPRRSQPNAKTRARVLALSPSLLDKTSKYVIESRARVPSARKHQFLFVASGTGMPLSIAAFAKIFSVMRSKSKTMPRNLFAHILRHTWNDRFSEEMDRRAVPEELEKKTRAYLMGWSETSGSAATYTRRHVRKRAEQASLAMQQKILQGGEDDA